jgi:hypothetical protein
MRWKIFAGVLNADILTDFLRRLTTGQPRKVFLIQDNLRVHHAYQCRRIKRRAWEAISTRPRIGSR